MEDRPDVHVMESDVLLKIESIKGKMTEACTQTELKGDKAAREPCISFRDRERELQAMRFTLTNSSHLHKPCMCFQTGVACVQHSPAG